jgi:hypothetical protein
MPPAAFVAFDVLAAGGGDVRAAPQDARRALLDRALAKVEPPIYVTPMTRDRAVASEWLSGFEGAGLRARERVGRSADASPGLSQAQIEAEPDGAQSESDLPRHIPESPRVIAAMRERERVEPETGERRKPTQHADKHERPHRGRQMEATTSNAAGQCANHNATDHVHHEGRMGYRSLESVRHFEIDPVTRYRSESAAECNRHPHHRFHPLISLDSLGIVLDRCHRA